MKRIAAPMIGGMVSVGILALVIVPLVFQLLHSREAHQDNEIAE